MEVKERKEIEDKYKWNLRDIYSNLEEFDKEYNDIKESLSKLDKYKDITTNKELKECLDFVIETDRILNKLYCYSAMYLDQEQNNEEADSLQQKVRNLFTEFSAKYSYINDQIIHFDDNFIKEILSDNTLETYHFMLNDILRGKSHVLSQKEEELLSKISDVFSTSDEVFTIFKNTELKYNKATLSNGEEIIVDETNYKIVKESDNRGDRKLVYDEFWDVYDSYKNTLSKLMFKFIKSNVDIMKIKNYDSSLQESLFSDNIPVNIYDNLIKNINNNLKYQYDYLKFRKEILNVEDDLHYYDLYNPIIKEIDNNYSFDKAKEMVINSVSILGEDYKNNIIKAFDNSWIDVYPNKYKDTGAYMNGSVYDVHPYVLLNYKEKYYDVSTLAHELGHAMHSVYSNSNQPYHKSSYSTYIAEIASTVNELLLLDYVLKNCDDKNTKIFLLNNYIEHFRTTVFRQVMFAEFEKFMYETVENDQMLTPSLLNCKYFELLEKYHGSNEGIVKIDDLYANEWSFIPHFYYNFYVYQYATSFISAVTISSKILNEDKEQLENYLELLKSGGSDYPILLLKKCGIDLSTDEAYNNAFMGFDKCLKQLKELLS